MRTLNAKQPYTECTFAFYKQRFQEAPDFFAVYTIRDSYCLIHGKKSEITYKLKFNEVRRELT